MTNVFADQEKFMKACDQTVGVTNPTQFDMYVSLIEEEFIELNEAIEANDRVEILDALLDILVVTIGAMHSENFIPEEGWKEVIRSNFAKIDSETGKVRRREDGKVLKPSNWTPPDLSKFVL